MTDTKTPSIKTDNNEDQNKQSDARIILGPLVKYAAMGFVLVSIIITTAVMLDRQFNDIDREVAKLEAQLAHAKTNTVVEVDTDISTGSQAEASSTVEADAVKRQEPAVSEAAEATEADKPATSGVGTSVVTPAQETQVVATQPLVTETIATETTAVEDVLTDSINKNAGLFDKSRETLIAERNAYLKEMDRVYLEQFKASQEKQLQFMRERLAHQQQSIEAMEKRNQEIYDVRADKVKEMQQMRDSFLADRI